MGRGHEVSQLGGGVVTDRKPLLDGTERQRHVAPEAALGGIVLMDRQQLDHRHTELGEAGQLVDQRRERAGIGPSSSSGEPADVELAHGQRPGRRSGRMHRTGRSRHRQRTAAVVGASGLGSPVGDRAPLGTARRWREDPAAPWPGRTPARRRGPAARTPCRSGRRDATSPDRRPSRPGPSARSEPGDRRRTRSARPHGRRARHLDGDRTVERRLGGSHRPRRHQPSADTVPVPTPPAPGCGSGSTD